MDLLLLNHDCVAVFISLCCTAEWISCEYTHPRASPVALVVKNPPVSAGDLRDTGSIPVWGRSPGRGNGNALQYSCLENHMDRGAWRAVVPGVAKSQTRPKRLSTYMYPLGINTSLSSGASFLRSHCFRSSKPWAEFLVLHGSFPPAVYFTHGSECKSALLFQFVPPSLSPSVSTHPFSTSAALPGTRWFFQLQCLDSEVKQSGFGLGLGRV